MKRRTLQQLIEQARRVRDDAAERMAGASRDVAQAQQTLDLLSNYLQHHLSPEQHDTGEPVQRSMLEIRERFTRKLDVAIGEQKRQRDGLQDAAERQRQELVNRQRRLLAFETLQNRRDLAARRQAQRADQRHTDEIAAQTLLRRARQGTRNES